jgi:hypothetical protein
MPYKMVMLESGSLRRVVTYGLFFLGAGGEGVAAVYVHMEYPHFFIY